MSRPSAPSRASQRLGGIPARFPPAVVGPRLVWIEITGHTAGVGGSAIRWAYAWKLVKPSDTGWADVTPAITHGTDGYTTALNGAEKGNPASLAAAGMTGAGVPTPITGVTGTPVMKPLGVGSVWMAILVSTTEGVSPRFSAPNTIACGA